MIFDADFTEGLTAQRSASASCLTVEDHVSSLYGAHRDAIYRFLVGQGISFATAQDLAQEVFVRLFVTLSKGTPIVSEQAWMYSVASKLAIDYWRREGRPMWVELDGIPALNTSITSSELQPDAALLGTDRLRRVAKAMAQLPKEQRLTIQLRMQGLRYREIAENLGISVSTAADWLSTAVERLRRAANE